MVKMIFPCTLEQAVQQPFPYVQREWMSPRSRVTQGHTPTSTSQAQWMKVKEMSNIVTIESSAIILRLVERM